MTTQNVAWPMMMVSIPNGRSAVRNAALRAMPGDDAGQRDGQDDQQADRLAAEEPEAMHREGGAGCPRTSAMAVAPRAARIDVHSASRTPVCSNACSNHWRLNPGSGHAWLVLSLKA